MPLRMMPRSKGLFPLQTDIRFYHGGKADIRSLIVGVVARFQDTLDHDLDAVAIVIKIGD